MIYIRLSKVNIISSKNQSQNEMVQCDQNQGDKQRSLDRKMLNRKKSPSSLQYVCRCCGAVYKCTSNTELFIFLLTFQLYLKLNYHCMFMLIYVLFVFGYFKCLFITGGTLEVLQYLLLPFCVCILLLSQRSNQLCKAEGS